MDAVYAQRTQLLVAELTATAARTRSPSIQETNAWLRQLTAA
jgi:hypothetical protein